MKTYTITITLDNAAFEDNGEGWEVSNILGKIAKHCRTNEKATDCTFVDSNGNEVGEAVAKDE